MSEQLRLVWPWPVCEGKQKGRGDPHITQSLGFVIAGFHNVSSVTICNPTFSKCFEDNPLEGQKYLLAFNKTFDIYFYYCMTQFVNLIYILALMTLPQEREKL